MNAAIPAAGCFHCGSPVGADAIVATVDGAQRPMCCTGCAAAASWIAEAGLADYYRIRDAAPAAVGDVAADYRSWDGEEIAVEHIVSVDDAREITVQAEGMRCAACAWLIDRALMHAPGVLEVSANAITGRVRLRWNPAATRLSQLLERLAGLGYRAHLASGSVLERARARERRTLLLRLGVAGLGAMQAMMYTEALYLDVGNSMPVPTRDFFRWIAFLLCAPVVFYSGWPFLAGMWRELSQRRLGMDTSIASAVLLAYGASLVETLRGGPHVWFDAAVMFVFLLLAARFVELSMRQRASAGIDALARARPAMATRLFADGSLRQVPTRELAPGMDVRVAAGEAAAADGQLLEAAAEFDEALLTGESRPVRRLRGDTILAGSVCIATPCTLSVTRTGADTWLSHLVRLVDRAQAARPRMARLADRVSAWFVAALFAVALLVAIGWTLWIDPGRAFEVTLAVLVVSCPCALSLAIPAAVTAAHGTLARWGVLAANADALETLARADTIVLDKTGTLTVGEPRIVAVEASPSMDAAEALRLATALQQGSGHPLARAFAGAAMGAPVQSAADVQDRRVVAGAGVEGTVNGRRLRLGRPGFAADGADDGRVWLGDGRRVLARFTLHDALREDARAAVAALKALGLRVEIASGDDSQAVALLAATLGVDAARGRQAPEDKLARVRSLQLAGHVVAMVGDGINDAPVLAGADVSIALGGGAALAQRAADFVITGERLLRVAEAVALARRTRRVIRHNLAWAVAYNVVALPFAAAGMVSPWLAALGMALSSLAVTLNALRLARGAPGQASPAGDLRPTPMAAPTGHAATRMATSAP